MFRLAAIAFLSFSSTSQAVLPKAFLAEHCHQCHGPNKQKADRRFDTLSTSIENFEQQELWQDIVDQLNPDEMPPKDKPQPTQTD